MRKGRRLLAAIEKECAELNPVLAFVASGLAFGVCVLLLLELWID